MARPLSPCEHCGRAHGGHEPSCPLARRAPGGRADVAAPPPVPASTPVPVLAAPDADARALLGRVVGGKYRPRAVLGEGGMGTVYEAEHVPVGRLVALKVLHPAHAAHPDVVRRFRREARAAAALGHPNICEIYDVGELEDRSPYLVMKRLYGETLADRTWREKVLPPAEAVGLASQVLGALGAAHEKGIVHRDVKPDNVFLAERPGFGPHVKLLDFGISKNAADDDLRLTRTGMIMGTPYYMAPEQARGEFIDARVDLYALGAVLYECVTGRRPFVSPDLGELLRLVLVEAPPRPRDLRPALPEALERVLLRALAKERTERFQTAREFLDALAPFGPVDGARLAPPVDAERPARASPAPPRTPSAPAGAVGAPAPVAAQPIVAISFDERTKRGLGPAPRAAPSALDAPPAPVALPALAAAPAPFASPPPGARPPSILPPPLPPRRASTPPARPAPSPPAASTPATRPPPPPAAPAARASLPPLPRSPSVPPAGAAPTPVPPPPRAAQTPPPPRRASAPPTPRDGGPVIVVLPPQALLPASLPSLGKSGGPTNPYRPQRSMLPPPPTRAPTPQGRPRFDGPDPRAAGAISVPSAAGFGPPRPPGATPHMPAAPPARAPLPSYPAEPLLPDDVAEAANERFEPPNAPPQRWHGDDDEPTRFYEPKRDQPTNEGLRPTKKRP